MATSGATHNKIMAPDQHVKQDEIRLLLRMLVDKRLLELDSFATYRTRLNGVKFLELRFNNERILQVQKSLV